MATETPRPVPEGVEAQVPTTEARQAITPHVSRYVLAYGLAGTLIGFVIAYIVFFG